MKLNLGFTVTARCVTSFDDKGNINENPKDFELDFNIESAQNLLMRFGPDMFDLTDDIAVKFLRKTSDNDFVGIMLIVKNDASYFVGNHEQFLRDVHEGYMKISALYKISTMIDFDYEAGLEFQE